MNNFSDYIRDFPIFSSLINKGRKLVETKASLLNLDTDLKELLKSNELTKLIKKCVSDIATNHCIDPLFLQQEQIILCNDFNGLVVAIGETKLGETNDPLYSSPGEALLGAISSEGFAYQFQEISGNWNHDIFSSDIILKEPQQYYCSKGNTVLVPISRIFDYRSSKNVIIKISGPAMVGLTWEFNRHTGQAERVHSSTIEATTLSYIIKFLSIYGNEDSIKAVSKLLSHQFHYIRWDVVKAIGEMSPENLHKILKIMTKDPHPHIRSASQKMLYQLGEY
jgi:hypothetical protein